MNFNDFKFDDKDLTDMQNIQDDYIIGNTLVPSWIEGELIYEF